MNDLPTMTGRQRVLASLEGRATDSLPLMPITMMFAADQIGVPYGQYAADYRVLAEGQIRTAEKFDFDHVSCISDPTREAVDCGAVVHFFPDQPPAFDETFALLADKKTLARLKIPDPLAGGRMLDRVQGVALLKEKVGRDKCVEGWIEGPGNGGGGLRGINTLMLDFYDDPGFVRDLLEFELELELRFAKAQVAEGADLIGIGDGTTSLVGPELFEEFMGPFQQRMIAGVHALGAKVRLHICGNTNRILGGLGHVGADMIDIDSKTPLARARAEMGPRQVLLGNIDPVATLRNGTPESIRAAIAECHQQAGAHYIVGAGCEVPRDTTEANIFALRDYARNPAPQPCPNPKAQTRSAASDRKELI